MAVDSGPPVDDRILMALRVLLSIPNTLSTRNVLRTGVLQRLQSVAERVTIVTPFADDPEFRREFVDGNVVAYAMQPYRPGIAERTLFRSLYNLYLSGDVPETLLIMLNRWADNHPGLGGLRRATTRRLLPWARPVTPAIEGMFLRCSSGNYDHILEREK